MESIKKFLDKLILKEEESWKKFLQKYGKLFTGISRYYSLPYQDFIQTLLEKLLERDCSILKKFYGNTELEFKIFIKGVATNLAKNLIRKEKYINSLEDTELLENKTPESYIEFDFLQMDIKNALEKIKKNYREVLYLRYYQHLKIKEISKKLNIPEKTVSTYINRGLKELRYYLQNTKANKIKKIERNF